MFSWEKIYYIAKKEGDNINIYFIFKRYEKCLIHNTYNCDCILEEKKRDHTLIIHKFLLLYKYCSTPFIIKNGNTRSFSKKEILNILYN